MSLQAEWDELASIKDPGKRARRFELFLVRLLEKESFKVTHNPGAAKPRQTDLAARGDRDFFLVEAKWTKRKVGIGEIAQVRDRLSRVSVETFACVFSVSGVSEPAIREVRRDKTREIYLFNEVEMRGIVEGRVAFHELLDKKREYLRMHGAVFLLDSLPSLPSLQPYYQLRSEPDVFEIRNVPQRWLRNRTGQNDIIFSSEFLDFSGRFRNSVFSLELRLEIDSVHDLGRTLNLLQGWFGLSGQGPFSIHQSGEGWFGFGLEAFISAVKSQEARYDELKWNSYHHSEELAYLDRLEGGGLVCLTSRQGTRRNYLHSTHVEFYFPGMPVNTANIRRLCKTAGDEEAHLELVKDNPVHTCRVPLTIELEPVGAIVSNLHGEKSVSGLVVKNPLSGRAIALGEEHDFEKRVHLIRESQFWICALRDWHNPGVLMKTYRLASLEACWIEHFCAFHLLCDWE